MARSRPLLLTVGISLEFPDGDLMFDEVDEVAVRFKSGFAMSGGGQGDDGDVADLQITNPMDCQSVGDGEFFERFFENSLPLFFGHERVVGILESSNIPSFMVIAYQSLEGNDGPAGGVLYFLSQGSEIDGGLLDGEFIHPRREA